MNNEEKILAIKKITDKEKNFYQFNYKWLTCFIIRHMWHLNWYVWLTNSNKNYNKDFQEIEKDIDIHWWLNFSWTLSKLWYDIKDYEHLSLLWFDCWHAWDAFIYPDYQAEEMFLAWEYKDYNFVLKEVRKLADQLV